MPKMNRQAFNALRQVYDAIREEQSSRTILELIEDNMHEAQGHQKITVGELYAMEEKPTAYYRESEVEEIEHVEGTLFLIKINGVARNAQEWETIYVKPNR